MEKAGMKPTEERTVSVPLVVVEATVQYLGNRPYREVAEIISHLLYTLQQPEVVTEEKTDAGSE